MIPLPWYLICNGVLLARYYEAALYRVTYILVLIYWFVWVAKPGAGTHMIYDQILKELLRSSHSSDGDRDPWGRHWTLNIAETFVLLLIDRIEGYFFPTRSWRWTVAHVLLNLLVFRHPVFELFLQKQVSRLIRFNRTTYQWRDYGIECFWRTAIRHLNHKVTNDLMFVLWWTCHQIYQFVTPGYMNQFNDTLAVTTLYILVFYGYKRVPPSLSYMNNGMTFYRHCLCELAKFSNPKPPIYKYSALKNPDHIRLVLLHPRFGFRPISCSLIEGPHMRLLFYEAISYTWGTSDRTEEIMVDGCKMMVTQSVFEILATYSSHFLPQLLWIDAICIDQDNNKEKSQQVPMMNKIYSNALFTTVFLGQSPLQDEHARASGDISRYQFGGIRPRDGQVRAHFETTRLTFDLFNEFRILEPKIRRSGKEIYEIYEAFSLNDSRSYQWSALATLLQHPWFARVWVVQEVVLSSNVQVHYGDETIDWAVIANALKMIHNLRHFRLWLDWSHGVQIRHTEHSSLYNIIRMEDLRGRLWPKEDYFDRRGIDFTQILAQSFYFKATNPRDQVYGMMSLCHDADLLEVDYEAPIEKVYIAAATELVRKRSFGLLFGTAGVGNRSEEGAIKLPSWVPDWTDAPKYNYLSQATGNDYSHTLKSEQKNISQTKSLINVVDGNKLAMAATLLDTLSEIGPALFSSADKDRGGGVIEEMCCLSTNYTKCSEFICDSSLVKVPYTKGSTAQSRLDAFHNTLMTGHDADSTEWVRLLLVFHQKPDISSETVRKNIYSVLQSMENITDKVELYCGGRRLFVSSQGWIGLCPPGTQNGDEIWVLREFLFPIILRKIDGDRHGRYKLVGECYFHGFRTEDVPLGAERTIEIV